VNRGNFSARPKARSRHCFGSKCLTRQRGGRAPLLESLAPPSANQRLSLETRSNTYLPSCAYWPGQNRDTDIGACMRCWSGRGISSITSACNDCAEMKTYTVRIQKSKRARVGTSTLPGDRQVAAIPNHVWALIPSSIKEQKHAS
jgi:hypothetical protein